MKVRIISGKFGGRLIDSAFKKVTHPMGDRVKIALFNILQSDINDAKILDAFAGTGSLGIEAMSRGADSAVFVERDRLAAKILRENLDVFQLTSSTRVFQMGLSTWIDQNTDKRFDIIFADPPYDDLQLTVVARLVNLLSDDGIFVFSCSNGTGLPENEVLTKISEKNYGTANLLLYRKTSKISDD